MTRTWNARRVDGVWDAAPRHQYGRPPVSWAGLGRAGTCSGRRGRGLWRYSGGKPRGTMPASFMMASSWRTMSTKLGRSSGACAQHFSIRAVHLAPALSRGISGRWPPTTDIATTMGFRPAKGTLPVRTSQVVMAKAYTSPACLHASPDSTSGAIQRGEPTSRVMARVSILTRLSPKSHSLATPLSSSRMFLDLRSLWMTLRSWRYFMPQATSRHICRAFSFDGAPSFRSMSQRAPPEQNSVTMWRGTASLPPMSLHTFTCCRLLIITNSARKLAIVSSENSSTRRVLTATVCPS
mmetsp:Transcript_19750/g.33937  ORF Transcript_19750/g.33937 Transcript_19750/m.33937 type:complete len:295 (+) Transcript_19750:426-1310(+)